MIVDCFTFFNELDVLELRLRLLDDVVDRFVLCEAPFTFRGDAKPLTFGEHAARFERWRERIVHLVYPAPADANPWVNEWGQRAYLAQGLAGCAGDDVVWIGDVDEFPDPARARQRPAAGRVLGFRMQASVGYVNRVVDEAWIGTRAVAFGDLAALGTPNDVRLLPPAALDLVDGGWHFSALGGATAMYGKLKSYAHAEYDVPYYTDRRRLELEFQTDYGVRWIPLDGRFPALLHEPRWSAFVWDRPQVAATEIERALHAHGCYAYVPEDAPLVAALTNETAVWQACGTARFGERFAGAFAEAAKLPLAPAGAIVVVDGLERWSGAALAGLRAREARLIAYVANARSYVAIEGVLGGAAFGPGRALGVPEARALVEQAGFRVESAETIISRQIFAPQAFFPAVGTFQAKLGPFVLGDVTREQFHQFVSGAAVIRAVPA